MKREFNWLRLLHERGGGGRGVVVELLSGLNSWSTWQICLPNLLFDLKIFFVIFLNLYDNRFDESFKRLIVCLGFCILVE